MRAFALQSGAEERELQWQKCAFPVGVICARLERRRVYRAVAWAATPTAIALLGIAPNIASATTYYWDTNGNVSGIGGSGTWSTSAANWSTSSSGNVSTVVWPNSTNTAVFGGTGGNVTLSGTVTTSGVTFDVSGTSSYSLTGATLNINSATHFTLNANQSESIADNIACGANANTFTLDGSGAGTLTLAGTISGKNNGNMLSISKQGNWTLILTNSSNYSYIGTLSITAGTLQVGNGGISGILSDGTDLAVTDNGTLAFDRSNTYAYGGVVSGTGALTQLGTGTLSLTASNSYSGITTISSGILNAASFANINTSSAIGKGSSGGSAADLVINGGTLQYTGSTAQSTNRLFTIGTNGGSIDASGASNVALNLSATGTIGVSGSGARTLTLTGSSTGANTLAGSIGDNGGATAVTKTGAGRWILTSTASSYSGATTITGGTLEVDGATPAASTVGISSGGTLTGTGSINGNATIASGGVINLGSSGQIGGTLTATGGAWNGNGTVNGAVTVSSNTLTIGAGANLTATSGVNVSGTGALAAGSSSSKITGGVNYTSSDASNWSGVLAGAASTLTVNNSNASLTLSGTNTFGGATNIDSGSLNVDGSIIGVGGDLTIFSGGELTGSGTIQRTVNIDAGGKISPASDLTVGTLSTGSENWDGGGSYFFSMNNATAAPGTGYDLLSLPSSTLDITATSFSQFVVKILASGPVANFDNSVSQSWVIAEAGSITGFSPASFTVDASGFISSNPLSPYGSFFVGESGSNITLNYVVPEPSSAALIVCGLLGFLGCRRRRAAVG